ncbi:photosynthetic complex putative assembly protein PuhB [Lutimaribacter marinistellae]|uniref:Photosynthetic complex putative assembly protein PuhB n=1 Tax=Lutimaribacter marinistellae TaxID=1820329 RepID=A0ABV7TFZ5_9RHOB
MSHDDFAFEPVEGLPERPPEGERILWQGRPSWWALTCRALNLYWVLGYFLALAAWRFATLFDQVGAAQAFAASFPFLILGAIVGLLLAAFAFVQARTTVYTITNRRVAMRIGAALTVTFNLPFRQLRNASLDLRRNGTGTIALEMESDARLSYLIFWPHVRPWVMRRTQPALRCIPEAEIVARILSEAAEAAVATPQIEHRTPQPAFAAE